MAPKTIEQDGETLVDAMFVTKDKKFFKEWTAEKDVIDLSQQSHANRVLGLPFNGELKHKGKYVTVKDVLVPINND